MVKDIVEPILKSTLPGPLANLKFVKIDLGDVPLRVSAVDTHKTPLGGIQLEMDVTWESKSDIELDGSMVPKIVRALHRCTTQSTDRITGHRESTSEGQNIGPFSSIDQYHSMRK